MNRRKPAFRPNPDLPESVQRKLGGYMARGAIIARGGSKAADQQSNLNDVPKKPEWATGTGTGTGTENMATGTSIFDPVLCELAYRWFCPQGGKILDPFAGGSVRGIVAAKLGFDYTGIDLSERQLSANRAQAEVICNGKTPRWICGDSQNAKALAPGEYDFLFSCPPYGDLEVYSDDPRDLSTMPLEAFLAAYRKIIAVACGLLKENRFAVFVVGDYRDAKGFYSNFVAETVAAFHAAGPRLYNEAVLVTAVGSLPIRIGKQMQSGRKLGKTHQNVLAFYKGDPKAIRAEFGECQFEELEEQANG